MPEKSGCRGRGQALRDRIWIILYPKKATKIDSPLLVSCAMMVGITSRKILFCLHLDNLPYEGSLRAVGPQQGRCLY